VLDVLLRTKIFEPLGMNDTGFWVDTSKANRVTSIFTSGPDTRLIRQLVDQALVDCQK
jgi:CubicO group peptidase (beta-lactamase class C family)